MYSIYPGRFLAEAVLFTTIARVLAVFDISPVLDDRGQPIVPPEEYTDGSITYVFSYTSTWVKFQQQLLITTVLVDARSGSLAVSSLVRPTMWNYCQDTEDRCGIARAVLPSEGRHIHQIEPSPRESYPLYLKVA